MSTDSKFTASVGELITFEVADKLIDSYKFSTEGKEGVINSFFFGKTLLQRLLDEPNAEGIRIHLGEDEQGTQKLVLFPADSNGLNIYVKNDEGIDSALDMGLPCPPYCPLV